MYIYNPTPEDLIMKRYGKVYFLGVGKMMSIDEETANFLMVTNETKGLVVIDPAKKRGLKNRIALKALEGLQRYLAMQLNVLDSFIQWDQELKEVNNSGTILKNKTVREVQSKIDVAKAMIEKIEKTYSISLKSADIDDKVVKIQHSIENTIKEFEQDAERIEKAKKEQQALDKTIEELLPDVAVN